MIASALGDGGALSHDCGGARDRIAKIEIVDGRTKWSAVRRTAPACESNDFRASAGRNLVDARKMRMGLEQRPPEGGERIVRQPMPEHIGERAQDRPILARVAWRERGARREL